MEVPGTTLEEVDGYSATIKGNPFRDGHVPLFSQVIIDDRESHFRQISPNHGRSYEIMVGNVLWMDEFGNLFSSLNSKGNNLTDPKVELQDNSPTGFLFFGLQDDASLARVIRASELLRSQNIDTEAIVKVITPTRLPYRLKYVPIQEFKEELINQAKGAAFHPKRLYKLQRVLDEIDFVITVRAAQVPERISDLATAEGVEDTIAILRRSFDFINFEEEIKSKKGKYKPEHFSADSKEDRNRFFAEYLPKRMARNFARMHRMGLIHKYTVPGNISVIGGIYDLDSVRGKLLGDKAIDFVEMAKDVRAFLYDQDLNALNVIENLIKKKVIGITHQRFLQNFIREYVREMGWEDSVRRFYGILILMEGLHKRNKIRLMDHYLDKIAEKENLSDFSDKIVSEIIEASNFLNDKDSDQNQEKLPQYIFSFRTKKAIQDQEKLLQYTFSFSTKKTIEEKIKEKLFRQSLSKTEKRSVELFAKAFVAYYMRNFVLRLTAA